jgi:hypothetical protein
MSDKTIQAMQTTSRLAVLEQRVDCLTDRLVVFERRLWVLAALVAASANAVDLWTLLRS